MSLKTFFVSGLITPRHWLV